MKTADELLREMKAVLAEHEAEAKKLRAMIAGAEGKPVEAPPIVKCMAPGLCSCPTCMFKALPPMPMPGLPFIPSLPTTPPWYVPVPSPLRLGDHGGNCACPACVGVTWCDKGSTSALVLTSPLVVETNALSFH